jgi:BlaI family penicillinase repressor
MASQSEYLDLSSRERQIMETLFRRGQATVSEIRVDMPEAPTSSAIRTMLLRLEEKGYLSRSQDGPRNVYSAAIPLEHARKSAVNRMMQTFFDGSPVKTVASFLDESDAEITHDELVELAALIEQAKKRGS